MQTNQQVCHAWAHVQSAKSGHLSTDGVTLTSYRTTIAARIDDVIYMSADSMSPTTGRHLSYAHSAVSHERDRIFRTHAFSWSGSNPAITHEAMLLPELRYQQNNIQSVLDSRARQATKVAAVQAFNEKITRIIEIAARHGVDIPTVGPLPVDEDFLRRHAGEEKKKRAEREEKEAERREIQRREDKEQFDTWLTTGAGHFPASYHTRETDYFTVRGDNVITSRGAEAPLAHVGKALRFYDTLKTVSDGVTTFKKYRTNGHVVHLGIFKLDSIDEQGNVTAGCHHFSHAVIEAFRVQWADKLQEVK